MCGICHKRSRRAYTALITLVTFSAWSLASVVPFSADAAGVMVGISTGSKEAQIAPDGKQWAALSGASTPVFDGTMLRTGNGAISVLVRDGTQLEVLPRSVIAISGSRNAPVIKIAVGRVLFRLPSSSATALATPSVRYQVSPAVAARSQRVIKAAATAAPRGSSDHLGEVAVTQRGGSLVHLFQGEIIAKPLNNTGLHIVKTGQTASLPPAGSTDPSFKILLAQALPGETEPPTPAGPADSVPPLPGQTSTQTEAIGSVPLYDQPGKSIGFCRFDGTYVSSPGITHGLMAPVQDGKIPPGAVIPTDAPPVFTADPEYAGYLRGQELNETEPPRCDCPIPVYDQPGKSIGYVDSNGSFVSKPRYTPDLANPVPAGTILPGVTIPPDGRPIFTVDPLYLGYLKQDDTLRDYRLNLATALRCKVPAAIILAGALPAAGTSVFSSTVGWGLGGLVTLSALAGGIAAATIFSGPPASPATP